MKDVTVIPADVHTPVRSTPARTRALLVVLCCLGAFMAFLDSTIVNIAFPDIEKSFSGSDLSSLSWVLNGYHVVIAAFLLPAGRAADRLGHRRAFAVGLATFTVASGVCGVASSAPLLIAARLVQAAGAAVLVPTSLALLLPLFPMHRRLAGITTWGAAAALAAGIGPSLGGLLVQDFSWRAVFLVNLPVGVVAIWGSRRLGEQREPGGPSPDVPGAVLLAGGLGLVALGLVKANDWHWGDPRTVACLAVGVALTAAVTLRSARHPAPVIALDLLLSRSSIGGNLGTMLFAVSFFGAILNNVLFLTHQWHWSVLDAGLAMTPAPLLTAVLARPASRLAERLGNRVVVTTGCAFYVAGTLLLAWGAGQRPDFVTHWLPGTACVGIGIGMVFPILAGAALADVTLARLASATAANAAFRQLGAVLGTTLVVSILDSTATPLTAARDAWYVVVGFAVAVAVLALASLRVNRS
jgi:NTE family protein